MENYDTLTKNLGRIFKKLKEKEGNNFKGYWSVAEHLTQEIVVTGTKTEYGYFDFIRFYQILPDVLNWISSSIEQGTMPNFNTANRLAEINEEVVRPIKVDILHIWLSGKVYIKLVQLKNTKDKSVKDIYLLEMLEDLNKNYKQVNRENIRKVKKELNLL